MLKGCGDRLMFLQDLMMDLEDIEKVRADLRFRGAQGTTGSQASFMEIFHGDGAKIDKLNEMLEKAGFPRCYSISTQTYTRKVDLRVANALSAFGATVQKIAGDIRHLAAQKEMEGKHILGAQYLVHCFMSCGVLVTQAEDVNTMLMTHASQLLVFSINER